MTFKILPTTEIIEENVHPFQSNPLLQDALQGGGGNWLKMQQLINELNDIYGLAPKEEYVTPAPVPNGLGFQDQ